MLMQGLQLSSKSFSQENLKLMEEGLKLFNSQKYWECHEALEHIWLEDRGNPIRYVYWAVIQIAAALVHYRDKNIIGARALIKKGKEKIVYCEKNSVESTFLNGSLEWEKLKSLVFDLEEDFELSHLKSLFNFRFKKYKKFLK